ncbi:hypothetical protein NQ315_000859 [Exocentrus adspersus]|uniref:pyrroline-5-carboxylate reductase n=1 Tax=Exocentrus adspersus TaxID=1586481 RepID=A0AAV8WED8_9CUCU|nr:hypothetical protein NQ315_000859 [Exocentrus adspersus]
MSTVPASPSHSRRTIPNTRRQNDRQLPSLRLGISKRFQGRYIDETFRYLRFTPDFFYVLCAQEIGGEAVFDNVPVVEKSDIVIISVKPTVVPVALSDIKASNIKADKLFLSIAMGVTTKTIEKLLPSESRVIRVMPNTPALVRNAASVFVVGKKATEADARITKKIVGVYRDLRTSSRRISGSCNGAQRLRPGLQALADGGVKMGLPRDLAYRLAAQTVLGAAQMVRDTNTHPGVLKDDVTSPAGSTAAGLHFLEKQGFRAAIIGAIESATERCREVSKTA